MVERSDDEPASVAAEEFEEITGHSARHLSVHRLRRGMPAYDRSWSALGGVSTPEGFTSELHRPRRNSGAGSGGESDGG